MIVKTAPGSLVHGRPMLPFEVKVNVVKVFPGMGDGPIWKGNQGGVDSLVESKGGYLVWPKYLMEEVLGENRVLHLVMNEELHKSDIVLFHLFYLKRQLQHALNKSNYSTSRKIGERLKIPRDLTEASLSGAGLSIIAAFSMMLLFGMVGTFLLCLELHIVDMYMLD
ncbi:hypothetical protein LguiB_013150 [Lonicera macranthoides]